MNIIELRAEVESQLEQAMAIDWSNPKNLSPLGIVLTFQMAAVKLLMEPKNQMAMYQNAQRKWLKLWGLG
jgi:hypothetical protein